MEIPIKTPAEIDAMRTVGRLAAATLTHAAAQVRPGMTTDAIDAIVHAHTIATPGAEPAPLGYHGYPKSVCTSVNDVVCHGIPDGTVITDGDILNIDVTTRYKGWHGDTSMMILVGDVAPKVRHLVATTYEAMVRGIRAVRPGAHLGDVGYAIQSYVEAHGLSVVRDYCGHGIGRGFHEDPQVPHYGRPGKGPVLVPGMIFTIEPMVNLGGHVTDLLDDGWTAVTRDHSLSAQWEHTVLVTDDGYEVLTLREGEEI